MTGINRLEFRMKLYARVELHAIGEISNPTQERDLQLLRARIAALQGQSVRQLSLPGATAQTTTTTLTTTTKGVEPNGDAETDADVPW